MAAGFKKATVNASDVPATQTNFPAYVDLSRVGITTLAEAQSVRVYADSAKTTEWAREIVSATEMHVKIPSLTSTVEIYVDWDGVRSDYAVSDTYGRNNVWSDYGAVYHLNDTTDSTGSFDLTNNNTVTFSTGKLGDGAVFGSSNTNKSLSYAGNLGYVGGNISVTYWLYRDTGDFMVPFCIEDNTSKTKYNGKYESGIKAVRNKVGGSEQQTSAGAVSSTTWTYISQTYDTSTLRLYVNAGTAITASASGSGSTTTTNSARIGADSHDTSGNAQYFFDGNIDEFRVRISTLSANWITTEYNNQSDESGFWGTWTDVGGAVVSRMMLMGVGT